MESPNTSHPAKRGNWDAKRSAKNKGFTLIEILITLAILVAIVSFGLFISFDVYKSYSFISEKNIIISVLQKVRSQAMHNVGQTTHGVHFQNNSSLKYIMFQCPVENPGCSYAPNSATDIVVESSYGISISNLPFDVLFDQLSGDCLSQNCQTNPFIITLTQNTKSYELSINHEGRIDF